MSLIHPAMLWGLAAVLLPLILHLLMRQKPKKLLFPALRLIEQRRRQNTKRMRLRHLWLLLLRMAVLGLIVLALTRPSLPAANYAFQWTEWLTTALIAIVALIVYFVIMRRWRRQQTAHHVVTSRRTMLRGLLGVATLALFALLVLWPYQRRIRADLTTPAPRVAEDLPVAAVFLFDTSLSMEYREESRTRLEVAQEIARGQLSRLPIRSRVSVADTSAETALLFQADLAAAGARIDDLSVHAVSHDLKERVLAACRLHADDVQRTLDAQSSIPVNQRNDRYLREIYVFTDLARSGWSRAGAKRLRDELERLRWLGVYLIDVGVAEPTNVQIGIPTLSQQTIPLGGPLIVEADVSSLAAETEPRTVELLVSDGRGQSVELGQRDLTLDGKSGARVQFRLEGLKGPIVQGELRLITSDPLPADNSRSFTIEVKPPPAILIVAPPWGDAEFVRELLAPREFVALGRAPYQCTVIDPSKLAATDLAVYQVVCLTNVPVLEQRVWNALGSYVEAGGGLVVLMGSSKFTDEGRGIDPVSYNSEAAAKLLPATLSGAVRFTPEEFLDAHNTTHPVLAKIEALGGAAMLRSAKIHRYWRVQPTEDAAVIVSYSDDRNSPALIERRVGQGRALMLTTALDRNGWSELYLSDAGWTTLALADQMMQYVMRHTDDKFNYIAGEDAFIRLPMEPVLARYLLNKPNLTRLPGSVEPGTQTLRIHDADQLGHYEVVSSDDDVDYSAGFSVVASPQESDFTRMETGDFDELLGEDRYSVTRDIEALTRNVALGRLGVEGYPMLVLFLVGVFALEHLAANRFYVTDQTADHEQA